MSKACLLLVLMLLVLSVACGSSSNNGPTNPFSNASLSGHYVYQISGTDFNTNPNGNPYRESGVFNANGGGSLTGGIDDFVENGGGVLSNPTTGSYNINGDGTGFLSLVVGTTTLNFALTMVSPSKVYLIEADSGLNSSGLGELQDATAIGAVPSGTFTFRTHILNAPPALAPTATVGEMAIASSAVTSGSEDSLTLGITAVPLILTGGTFGAPDANGRGQFSLKDNSPKTTDFIYYIVDANNIRLLATDTGFTGQGSAEKQSGTLALSGSYAFGSQGDTNNFGIGGVNSAGRFAANSTSLALAGGAVDTVQDGVSVVNKTFTGSFTAVNASGRSVVTFSTGAQGLFWMVSPARAFFMFNDANKVEDGTVDQQLLSTFSNSTMKGAFALVMGGFDTTPEFINRVGALQWDGSGHLSFGEFVNNTPLGQNSATLSGTYSVSGNGRVAATINGISLANGDQVFYLISGNDAYFLINDQGVQINGMMSKQP
jgi:hypothetical protein